MKKSLFIFMLLGVLLIHGASQIFFIQIPGIIFWGIYVLLFSLVSKKNILSLYLYLIFLSSGINLYALNIIFVIFLTYKFFKEIKLTKIIFIYFIILLIEGMHILGNSASDYNDTLLYYFGFAICFLPFFFIKEILKISSLKNAFYGISLGFFSFVLILLAIYYFHYGMAEYFTIIRRFGFLPDTAFSTESLVEMNPNTIGKFAGLIIIATLILIKKKIITFNFLNVIILFFSFLIGLLTLSRAFILVMIITLIYLFFSGMKVSLKQFYITIVSLLVFACMNLIIIFLNPKIYEMISFRIFETEDISGQRFTIYENYSAIILNNLEILLFGVGMQNYIDKLASYGLIVNQSAHNLIIEIIVIWGLIGLVLILLLFITLIWNGYKSLINKDKVLVLPILALLIFSFFGQYFISFYHTFAPTYFALMFLYSREVQND